MTVGSEGAELAALEKNAVWSSGSQGYLVSTAWWNNWVAYSGYAGPGAATASTLLPISGGGGPRPGPISNSDLLLPASSGDAAAPALPGAGSASAQDAQESSLRPGLVEHQDFVVVSEAGWQKLVAWYGGGPAIVRNVVVDPAAPAAMPAAGEGAAAGAGGSSRWSRLVLYPLSVEVNYTGLNGMPKVETITLDPEATLATLKQRACKALHVAEADVALWDYSGGAPVRSLEEPEAAPGPAATAVQAGGAAAAAGADGPTSMEVDGGAAAGGNPALARRLCDIPLLDDQALLLRRKDAAESDSDGDACGSDHDTGVGKRAGGKAAAGDQAPQPVAQAAADAALRRANAAGASGSGLAARTSGGGNSAFGANRFGSRPAFDDNVNLRDGQPPGLAGLSNLGNTCFMNSSLQCLAHAVPLMEAFLGATYLKDLNRTNPLGMKGELAEAFGALMQQLWRGGVSSVTPRSFKAKIGRFAPQFSGYAQHDSQEFLAFLLDGLHEDTNRIKSKPYFETKDEPGRPDEELAAEAWSQYRARNDSLVVDHFQGLLKSGLDCPKCAYHSVKFDPFMYLSLPLPESRRRVVEVVLVRTDGSGLPTRLALELPSGAAVGDLLKATARAAGLPEECQASPEAHLLAARPLRSGPSSQSDELVLVTDIKARVADALDAGGSGYSSYSLRSTAQHDGLIVYHYADAARGPKAEGLAPVIVHFKRPEAPGRKASWLRGVWCGAPLVLYLPADTPPYDPDLLVKLEPGHGTISNTRAEWEVGGNSALAAALVEVLRPIQRGPLPPPLGPGNGEEGEEAAAAAAGGGSAGAGQGGEGVEEGAAGAPAGPMEADGPGARTAAGSGAEQMEGLETAAAAATSAAPAEPSKDADGDAVMPGTPPPATVVSASAAPMEDDEAAPAQAAEGGVILLGPPAGEDAEAGPTVAPFNMWSAQESTAAASGSDAGAAATGKPGGQPFSLRLCNAKGDPMLWGGSFDKEIDPQHQREFMCMFSEACALPEGEAGAGPYAAEALDRPDEHESLRAHRQRAAAGPQPVALEDCMRVFLQPERLDESDAWYCPRCKEHVCADKKLDLWSLPEVLVVHLKRFSYTRHSRNKLDTRVDFPLHGLDLGSYVLRPQGVAPLYDCFAVSNHYGSMGGGHYTAYAKLPGPPPGVGGGEAAAAAAGEKWYCFDDSHVSAVEPDSVRSSAAYVLFYRRRKEAAADAPLPDLLSQLATERAEVQAEAGAAAGAADGRAAGSPGSGSDRQADQDQDRDRGPAAAASRQGLLGAVPRSGPVSLAEAAVAAAKSRSAAAASTAGGGGDEELQVTGRSMAAFTSGGAGTSGARLVSAGAAGLGLGGNESPDLYGDDGGDNDAVAAPSSPVPLAHGGAGSHFDREDFGAFELPGTGGKASAGAGSGGGSDPLLERRMAALQPPGSPSGSGLGESAVAAPGSPDMNNGATYDLYAELDDMDVPADRPHSVSDMASAGGDDVAADDVDA
ncbi:hypothetical protein HYH02_002290 [Chlamydomonas schloesseri]|uniref:ubiquitinyl hydrolase 1 n=1 Tax=Chlamydomonas schloesseri TaxID=2026947 RepID=A0A835WRS3_9CHLO|nr:hypothetical protein HYH02_002290 [Chlamydomonas schloesseri]|eukprot:KAG2452953.1 hypothetical protein HYH02_002290 [Chlamydomonas schloesseri]